MKKLLSLTLATLMVAALTFGAFAADAVPTTQPTLPSGLEAGFPQDGMNGAEMDKDDLVLLLNSKNAKVFGTDTQIDAENEKVVPFVETGRTLVPNAFLAEAYGATTQWDSEKQEVTFTTATETAIVTINSKTMVVNGKNITLDVPARIVESRTYLPLRAIAEIVLDKKVAYSKGLIYITDEEVTLDEMKVNIMSGMLSGERMPGGPGGMMPGGSDSSLDTSTVNTKYLDLTYVTSTSPSKTQKLDIYMPNEGDGPFPVIIQIHGGAFKSGAKSDGQLVPVLKALDKGYAVVSVEYRLSSEAQFPAQINDIKAATRFLRANAEKYNLNPDKFATWGGSAGGSLSALAATSGGVEALQDDTLGYPDASDSIQACIDQYGPIYFSTMDDEFAALSQTAAMGSTNTISSPETAYLGATTGTAEAEPIVIASSAQTYITEDDPACYIQHGTADRNVPINQSINFSNKLIETLGSSKVTFDIIEGAGHGGSQFETDENLAKLFAFLDTYLK